MNSLALSIVRLVIVFPSTPKSERLELTSSRQRFLNNHHAYCVWERGRQATLTSNFPLNAED